jgi:hypothetical protein
MSSPDSSRLDELGQRGLVGDVHRGGEDRPAVGAQPFRVLFQCVLASGTQCKVAAFGGQLVGDRPAEAAARAGDEGFPSRQLQIHRVSVLSGGGGVW